MQQDGRHPPLAALQSLRGLAALVVLLHHASFLFATSPGLRSATEILFNAHAAVVVFFVLSGFVLCRSLGDGAIDAAAALRFWVRRAFRIYPGVWLACALGWLYLSLLAAMPTPMASLWFVRAYPVAAPDIVRSLAGIDSALVMPLWSVRVELVMSALMPLLWLAVRRGWGVPLLVAAAAASLGAGALHPELNYAFCFVIGAVAARHVERFAVGPGIGVAAVLVLLLFRRINPAWAFEIDFAAAVPTLVESLAGAVVVLWLAGGRGVPAALQRRPLTGLGDISFGLYVLHFPILSALSKLPVFARMAPDPAALLLTMLTLAVTLPLAALSYRWIERPGIALGQRLAILYRRH